MGVFIVFAIITQLDCALPELRYFKDGIFRGIIYLLLDFIGVSSIVGTPSICGTWWYMSAALLFIVLTPFVVKAEKQMGVTVMVLLIVLPRIILNGDFYGTSNAYSFVCAYLMGVIFARYKIFDKLDSINIKGNKTAADILLFVALVLILPVIYILWHRLPYKTTWEYHFAIAPMFVIVFCQKFIVRIPVVSKVLAFIGKHSMNVFLLHTFLRYNLIPEVIYGAKYALLVIPFLLVLSLAISVLIEFFKKLIKYDKFIDFISGKIQSAILKQPD